MNGDEAARALSRPIHETDWRPNDLTPDLSRALMGESLSGAREAVAFCFGVLPAWFNPMTTGPLVREAQRHLVQFVLQPIAELVAQEASDKLGGKIALDLVSPLQAFDQGGRARAFATMIEGLSAAKAAGLSPDAVKMALQFIDEAPRDE